MPFTPLDISGVESIGAGGSSTSIIYYVDGDGILSSVQAAQQQGKPNNVIYDLNKIVQVLQNGNKFPVKPTYKFLDAVAYDYNGQRQVSSILLPCPGMRHIAVHADSLGIC